MGTGRSLSDGVYASLLDRVLLGELKPGDLLPKEDELALSLNVSRTVLREALARLRHEGLIDSKRGTGNRVIGTGLNRSVPIFAAEGANSVAELQACFEFRLGLEPVIAAAAALRANRSDLMQIENAAQALEAAVLSNSLGADEDIAFHTAIAAATHNSFYLRTIAAIARPVEVGMQVARALSSGRQGERLTTTIAEHRSILDALVNGNAEAAQNAMRQHLESTIRRVFDSRSPKG